MSTIPAHNDATTINRLWDNINQGWLVLKLVELILIPYVYYLLKPNKVLFLLFCGSLLNIPHNVFGFTAFYISRLYPTVCYHNIGSRQGIMAHTGTFCCIYSDD
jgi:hypothetical protein